MNIVPLNNFRGLAPLFITHLSKKTFEAKAERVFFVDGTIDA